VPALSILPERDEELERDVRAWLSRIPEPERRDYSSEALAVMYVIRKILEARGRLPPLR